MSMKGQPMNLTIKSVSALLLVGSLSACGGGGGKSNTPQTAEAAINAFHSGDVVNYTDTVTTEDGKVIPVTVSCQSTRDCTVSTDGVSIDVTVTTNDNDSVTLSGSYLGEHYLITINADGSYSFQAIDLTGSEAITESGIGLDLNNDGDLLDTVSGSDDDISFEDNTQWGEWTGTNTFEGGVESTAYSDWSAWSPESASITEEHINQTRTRTKTVSTTAKYEIETRTNDFDSTDVETRKVLVTDPTSTSSTETETRTIDNPDYDADAAAVVGTYLEGVDLTLGTADTVDHIGDFATELSNLEGVTETATEIEDSLYETLNITGLEAAHDNGWTGKDVEVVVVEVAGSGTHATDVSNIVNLTAPGANLNTFKWSTNHFINAAFMSTVDYAVSGTNYNRAEVINLSLGCVNPTVACSHSIFWELAGIDADEVGDTVFTISNGNDGLSNIIDVDSFNEHAITYDSIKNIDMSVLAPAISEGFAYKTIAVGALDPTTGLRADYSNAAGSAMNWTLLSLIHISEPTRPY